MRLAGTSCVVIAVLLANLSLGLFCPSSHSVKTTPTTASTPTSEAGAPPLPAELRLDADAINVAGPQLSPATVVPTLVAVSGSPTQAGGGFPTSSLAHPPGDLLQLQHVLRI